MIQMVYISICTSIGRDVKYDCIWNSSFEVRKSDKFINKLLTMYLNPFYTNYFFHRNTYKFFLNVAIPIFQDILDGLILSNPPS